MKVKNIDLLHYRGFEQADIEFEEDLTVIAGVNGVGKSGILDALSSLLSYSLPEYTSCNAEKIYGAIHLTNVYTTCCGLVVFAL